MAIKNLIGQTFGRLMVIEDTKKRQAGKVVWKCQCNCGNIKEVVSTQLISGKTQSCGCLQKERTSQASTKDLTNLRFGLLVVKQITDERRQGRVIWKCQCDCGNIVKVGSHELLSNKTISCGCLTESRGEIKIKEILTLNKIPFETQKTFTDCIFINTGKRARFDFYVNNQYLIEYDGIQHFKIGSGWNNPDNLKATQSRDAFKDQWCKDNKIPLIRIPYTHFDNITIKDLLLETSQFIINKNVD